jgi:hypothetical protein
VGNHRGDVLIADLSVWRAWVDHGFAACNLAQHSGHLLGRRPVAASGDQLQFVQVGK